MKMADVLASFEVRVMGVCLNDVPRGCCTIGTPVEFRRDPGNPFDRNCVDVFQSGQKLGHVARTAAALMCRLIERPYRITGCVVSTPHSVGPNNNWSWRYRVVDVCVVVSGRSVLPQLEVLLAGARRSVTRLRLSSTSSHVASSSQSPSSNTLFPLSPPPSLSPSSASSVLSLSPSSNTLSPSPPSSLSPLSTFSVPSPSSSSSNTLSPSPPPSLSASSEQQSPSSPPVSLTLSSDNVPLLSSPFPPSPSTDSGVSLSMSNADLSSTSESQFSSFYALSNLSFPASCTHPRPLDAEIDEALFGPISPA